MFLRQTREDPVKPWIYEEGEVVSYEIEKRRWKEVDGWES